MMVKAFNKELWKYEEIDIPDEEYNAVVAEYERFKPTAPDELELYNEKADFFTYDYNMYRIISPETIADYAKYQARANRISKVLFKKISCRRYSRRKS